MPEKRTVPAYIFGSAKAGETARAKAGRSRIRPLPTFDEMKEKGLEREPVRVEETES